MRTAESMNISGVFNSAAHLFGHTIIEAATPSVAETVATVPNGMAVHPYIDKSSFALTMDNYRKYADNYKSRVKQENELVAMHNSYVQMYLAEAEITEADKTFIALFHKNYGSSSYNKKLNDREYNDRVTEFCSHHGHLIEKRRIQPLRYQTELVFQNFLHLYSVQVNNRTENYIKYGVTAPRPLQELEIRADKVTNLQRNGIKSLSVCNKTVRNHRQRLEEAGVLTDYQFCGHVAGVHVKVNPEILTFTDLFAPVEPKTENQPVNQLKRKKLPYVSYDLSTGTSKNECKIKDDAVQSSVDKECPADTGSFHYKTISTKTTGCKEREISPGATPDNVKVEKTTSEKLRDLIIHPQELAVNLAKGVYFNHVPIDIREIYKEASRGTLTDVEFRELIIQEHFKSFSKIYRNATPYAGSWKKAINEWMDNRWITHANRPFDKMTIANYVEEYRWCIENARKWFNKTGVNPLFPSDYFDMTRKKAREVGFEYQRERYKRHLKAKENKEITKRKREKAAELRRIQGNDAKRLKTETNRFLKGKITLPQLENYVRNVLPPHYLHQLPEYLKKRMDNL